MGRSAAQCFVVPPNDQKTTTGETTFTLTYSSEAVLPVKVALDMHSLIMFPRISQQFGFT